MHCAWTGRMSSFVLLAPHTTPSPDSPPYRPSHLASPPSAGSPGPAPTAASAHGTQLKTEGTPSAWMRMRGTCAGFALATCASMLGCKSLDAAVCRGPKQGWVGRRGLGVQMPGTPWRCCVWVWVWVLSARSVWDQCCMEAQSEGAMREGKRPRRLSSQLPAVCTTAYAR